MASFSAFLRRLPLINSGAPSAGALAAVSRSTALPVPSAESSERISVVASARSDDEEGPSADGSVRSVTWLAISSSEALSKTNRAASASSGSSIVMVTSASPSGGRFSVPLKMQSDMRPARSDLWLCSPSTQEIASTTLDLPQPLGPTMQVVPEPLNVTVVRSQNDLKPTILTFRSFSKISPFGRYYSTAASAKLECDSKTAKASHLPRPVQKQAKRDDL